MMQTTSANRVTPSISAAAMIIEVRMSPPADGWRAVPSMAVAAGPAMAETGAEDGEPGAEPRGEVPKRELVHRSTSHSMNALSLGGEEWHVVAGNGPEAARAPPRDQGEEGG